MFGRKSNSKLKDPNSVEHGYGYALFILGLRLRTEGEIVNKMQGRGYADEVIEKVITQLKDNAYIDDLRYAEVIVENFKKYKTYGYFLIKKKMLEKKLPSTIVERSLPANLSMLEEFEIAKRYIKKEGLEVREGQDYQLRQKIAYKLNSRGFRNEVISAIFSGEVPETE